MIYVIYFDPEVIQDAANNGPYAIQALIAALRGFSQNCLFIDFTDARIRIQIGEAINTIPSDSDRILLTRILAHLAKYNRFIGCILPDYLSEKQDSDYIIAEIKTNSIDFALLSKNPINARLKHLLSWSELDTYQATTFEHQRESSGSKGKVYTGGELTCLDFMNHNFRNLCRYSASIQVVDNSMGKYYGSNYEYCLITFIEWLESVIYDASECRVDFHCCDPSGYGKAHINAKLTSAKNGRISALPMTISYYNNSIQFHHDRFIVTDQFTFEIGRGMDFLDPRTLSNRDVSLSIKDTADGQKLMKELSSKSPSTDIL